MHTLLAYYSLFLSFALVAIVLIEYLLGKSDLCSLRNVAILGFVIFQLLGAFLRLYTETYHPFRISDPNGAAVIYLIWATIFAVLMLGAYRLGWGAKWLASKVPVSRTVPADSSLLAMAGVLAVMGLIMRLSGQIPLLGSIADYMGTGYAAMAAGLCGWVWAKRFLNPLVIAYTGFICSLAMATVMYSAFGRRGLVAVGAGLLWGMYYGALRDQKPLAALSRLGLVGIFPLIFVALYTSVRSASEHNRTAGQHLTAIVQGGSVVNGMALLFEGQNVANEGFWLIENYPASFPYRWFFTLQYTVEVLVPRVIYPDKPYPLSNLVANHADMKKVNQDKLKMSPGILGSAATEGGTIAVIVYAIFAGLFLRFYDQLCILHPHSPLVVLPVASAIGQVLGFARGETSVMVNAFMLATFGCWLTMLMVGKMIESFGGQPFTPQGPPDDGQDAEHDPHHDPHHDPYEQWQGYGHEAEAAAAR